MVDVDREESSRSTWLKKNALPVRPEVCSHSILIIVRCAFGNIEKARLDFGDMIVECKKGTRNAKPSRVS